MSETLSNSEKMPTIATFQTFAKGEKIALQVKDSFFFCEVLERVETEGIVGYNIQFLDESDILLTGKTSMLCDPKYMRTVGIC